MRPSTVHKCLNSTFFTSQLTELLQRKYGDCMFFVSQLAGELFVGGGVIWTSIVSGFMICCFHLFSQGIAASDLLQIAHFHHPVAPQDSRNHRRKWQKLQQIGWKDCATTSYRQRKDFNKISLQHFMAQNVDVHLYMFYAHCYIAQKQLSNFAWVVQQEAQLMLTTGSTRLPVNQGQQNSTIQYVTYSFLLCNSNLSLRYSTSKNVVTLKCGSKVTQGHWEWYHSIDCVWFPISVL